MPDPKTGQLKCRRCGKDLPLQGADRSFAQELVCAECVWAEGASAEAPPPKQVLAPAFVAPKAAPPPAVIATGGVTHMNATLEAWRQGKPSDQARPAGPLMAPPPPPVRPTGPAPSEPTVSQPAPEPPAFGHRPAPAPPPVPSTADVAPTQVHTYGPDLLARAAAAHAAGGASSGLRVPAAPAPTVVQPAPPGFGAPRPATPVAHTPASAPPRSSSAPPSRSGRAADDVPTRNVADPADLYRAPAAAEARAPSMDVHSLGRPPETSGVDLPRGTVVDAYTIQGRIAVGSMGAVFQARDEGLGREVAIKFLTAGDPTSRERFLREARTAARLNHPHIVAVHGIGRHETVPYIVTELLTGGSLDDRVRRAGPMVPAEAAALTAQAARALDFAHRKQVVHRDVKPANLLLTEDGQVKVSDFGLAWAGGGREVSLTGDGMLIGTPQYMAPEQAREAPAAPAGDIYALGCTLYYLLTGEHPFVAPSLAETLRRHAQEPMPDPRARAPEVPPAMVEVLRRAAAKNPADRYPDAAAMAEALEALDGAAEPAPAAAPVLPKRPIDLSGPQGLAVVAIVAGAAVLVGLMALAGVLILLLRKG
jgi:hypothetical protein